MADMSRDLQQQVQKAYATGTPLKIGAGHSKPWYGRDIEGEYCSVSEHCGVLAYRPAELTLTVRAGTPLQEVHDELAVHGQCLAFEPPMFSENSTIGGTVACGFSGSSRAFSGACRDYVLGCRILNGRGDMLRFGGEVMKNVAGFDVSRLMVGSLGTLGLLLDVSFKIMPKAQHQKSFFLEGSLKDAVALMSDWKTSHMPLTALAADSLGVYLRLSGSMSELNDWQHTLNATLLQEADVFWQNISEHRLSFFDDSRHLWRLSLPPSTPHFTIKYSRDEDWLWDWGGAQRWLLSDVKAEHVFHAAQVAGGHATLFRAGTTPLGRYDEVFSPLPTSLMQVHQRLKKSFDPKYILNRGRMYANL